MAMYYLKRPVTIILMVGMVVGLAACAASTTLSNRWHDPNYSGASIKKVFVIALVTKEVNRRALEDSYIVQLKKHGTTGIASYRLIADPKKARDEKKLKAIITNIKADAVIISRFEGVSTETTQIPPRVDVIPMTRTRGYHRGYYGYYNTTHHAIYQPGYTRVDKVVSLETKMFTVKNEKMVWDGNTKSFNPKTADKVIKEITKLVIDDMKSSGLIGN